MCKKKESFLLTKSTSWQFLKDPSRMVKVLAQKVYRGICYPSLKARPSIQNMEMLKQITYCSLPVDLFRWQKLMIWYLSCWVGFPFESNLIPSRKPNLKESSLNQNSTCFSSTRNLWKLRVFTLTLHKE